MTNEFTIENVRLAWEEGLQLGAAWGGEPTSGEKVRKWEALLKKLRLPKAPSKPDYHDDAPVEGETKETT
jgi:hypothetical protein